MKLLLSVFALLLMHISIFAQQTGSVSGSTADAADGKSLKGATILLRNTTGKSLGGAISDGRGRFHLGNIAAGRYELVARYIGYDSLVKSVSVKSGDTTKVGTLSLKASALLTKGVEVTGAAIRVEVRGDTSEYNAMQFKTDKNAAAEDMIRKMPGIEIDQSGQVKAQGEQVRKVLVDGKPFFGGDPAAALKNLPSEVIDKIQVYDQMSDQSAFTRFDDGDRTKTLNIVMRQDKKRGQFGKLYAGYGTENRYSAGGNVNIFDGDRRISIIGMSNNINQQNFSIQDILGVIGGGGNPMYQRMGGMMRAFGGGSGMGGRTSAFGGGGGRMGGAGISDFLVQQSDGITSAHSLGFNYSDNWDKNLSFSGSYFVNKTDNESEQSINRLYFLTGNANQTTIQDNTTNTDNINHRINLRFDYSVDSLNSISLTPRLTFQSADKPSASLNSTLAADSSLLNTSDSRSSALTKGLNFNNDLLFRHRFLTEGRTFSININTSYNDNNGETNTTAKNMFMMQNAANYDTLLQHTPSLGDGLTLGANINYTEPLFENSIIQLSYNENYSNSAADRKTYWPDSVSSRFDFLQPSLSNKSESKYITHRPGATLKYNFSPTANFSIGADYQIAEFTVSQTFPQSLDIAHSFRDLLPSLAFSTRPSMTSNIRLHYRTSTNQPLISQLQSVVDNSDPLRLTTGNPNLKQEYSHSIFTNYGMFDMASASAFFIMFSGGYTAGKISTSSFIAQRDTILAPIGQFDDSVRLGGGAQISRPVNLDGYWTARSFVTYSFPVEPIDSLKLNLSFNAGATFSRTPSLVNGVENIADNLAITPSLAITSNINENIDFSLSWRGVYNIVTNSLRKELNDNYYTHTFYGRLNWIFWGGLVLSGDMSYIINGGLSGSYNQNIPLLSLGLGYRLFDGDGEVKLSVFDAMNQNKSVGRDVTGTYIEDSRTKVLQRYALLTFTYNLRRFGQ